MECAFCHKFQSDDLLDFLLHCSVCDPIKFEINVAPFLRIMGDWVAVITDAKIARPQVYAQMELLFQHCFTLGQAIVEEQQSRQQEMSEE